MIAPYASATIVTNVVGAPLGQPAECASLDCSLTFGPVYYDGPSAGFWTRGYSYNGAGALPGPTIRASAGDTLRVTLVNELADLDNSEEAVTAYTYMMLNSTNLHTHGLHISPSSPADDVFMHVDPGQTATYEYVIPADHAGGVFWYHPHSHGSSAIQTVGGAAGLLIIDDAENEVPPEVAAMEDVVLVMNHMDMATMVSIQQGVSSTWANAWADQLWKITGTTEGVMLVNGQTDPTMVMAPNTWYRWRLLFVTDEMDGTLSWITNTAGCEMQLLAKDGVYLPTAPRAISSIPLYSALRSDLAVRCTAEGSASIGVASRRRRLRTEEEEEVEEEWHGHDHGGRRLPPGPAPAPGGGGAATSWTGTAFSITVTGTEGTATMLPSFSVYRPCYLADTIGAAVDTSFSVAFDQNFNVNGQKFTTTSTFLGAFTTGQLAQITLADINRHPFHIHVNHFQITSSTSAAADPIYFQTGDWHDTLYDPSMNTATVRMYADKYTGLHAVHCHIFTHGDKGMMGIYNVGGTEGAVNIAAQVRDSTCFAGAGGRGGVYTETGVDWSTTVAGPTKAPTAAALPVPLPTKAPILAPTKAPTGAVVPVPAPTEAPTKAPSAAAAPGSAVEVFNVKLGKSPSGMYYYPAQGLLYVLCGTATNSDHYLYAYSLAGAQQCLITIPQAVGMSRVDGFTINAAGTKAYIADSQGPIYASTMLGGSIYELVWDNPCGCTAEGTCASTAVSWTPTITNTIVLDALDPAISDGGGADDYYRNSGALLTADELSIFSVDGVHPISGSLSASYPKSLLKISLADGSVEQRWAYDAATLGHDVDFEALTCGPDACAEFLYIGDEWNYVYQMRISEADPGAAIVQEWDLSTIVDSTSSGTISNDKGIESLTYSAATGYFYVGIQDSSYLHVVTLSGAVDVSTVATPAPTTAVLPVPAPTKAPTGAVVPVPAPTSVQTSRPSFKPTVVPIPKPTFKPTDAPFPKPTLKLTDAPLPSPTPNPTSLHLPVPSQIPIPVPSSQPSSQPFPRPTLLPTTHPSVSVAPSTGTSEPTEVPFTAPTTAPMPAPAPMPTDVPMPSPTAVHVPAPTTKPTDVLMPVPTRAPALMLTPRPTDAPVPNPMASPTPWPYPKPTAAPQSVPISAPFPAPTLEPVSGPSFRPSLLPTSADSAAVYVSVVMVASAALPTEEQEAEIKGVVADELGLPTSALHGFKVISAPVRRRLLSGWTWALSFTLVASLAATGASSAADLATNVGATIASPAFASAVSSGVSGVTLAVDAGSVVTAPLTNSPTLQPTPEGDDSGGNARSSRGRANAASVGLFVGIGAALLILCTGGAFLARGRSNADKSGSFTEMELKSNVGRDAFGRAQRGFTLAGEGEVEMASIGSGAIASRFAVPTSSAGLSGWAASGVVDEEGGEMLSMSNPHLATLRRMSSEAPSAVAPASEAASGSISVPVDAPAPSAADLSPDEKKHETCGVNPMISFEGGS